MGGAYQLTLSRATVVEVRDGEPTGRTWGPGTVTIRDGLARMRVSSVEVASMPANTFVRISSRSWTIHEHEGTVTWQVAKSCGCGG